MTAAMLISSGSWESAGINQHGGGDGRALRRRARDPRRPRVMRRRPARTWRSVDRGTCMTWTRLSARKGWAISCSWSPAGYSSRPNSATPAGIARKYRGYLMARLGCFFLKDRGAGRATCRVPKIDVRHIAAWQAVSQHDAVTADQELTDAGLVVACAGFDD